MRILDEHKGKGLQKILLLLTSSEASELRDTLNLLLSNSDKKRYHLHVNDSEFIHEITVSLYYENDVADFDDRVQDLITNDK